MKSPKAQTMMKRLPKYEKMFEPGHLGSLTVKNRLLMAPMGTRMASEIGGITQQQIDYYVERAKGGVGTILTDSTVVDYPLGATGASNMTLHDNSYIGGHNELVEAVHAYDTRIICQLKHAGRETLFPSSKGMVPVAPSAIPCKFFNVVPKELSTAEVEGIVKKFVETAVRVQTAGYDGVELHGAHGYLIAQFMSASSNKRQDRYGGSLLGRMAFPLEIVRGIRANLGPRFPLLFRFSAEEFIDEGRRLEESKEVARILEESGVDALHVSAGTYDSITTMIEPMSYGEAWKIYLAEAIGKVVKIPVIGVGVIRTPAVAEAILQEGKADFVALGRTLLADPYWPQKAREGREKEIVPCLSCNIGCIGGRIFRGLHIRCTVNPLTGRERLLSESLRPAPKKKKVFIVGGGPAGMVAALASRKKGHQVILFEKSQQLGGQLTLGCKPPGKEKIARFRDYLLHQIGQKKIKVRLGEQATKKSILQGRPDAVILATGAVPLVPDIPGIDRRLVCTAWEVLEGKRKIKGKSILVAGAGTVGCETALYLQPDNKKVVIVEMLEQIAADAEPINRRDLIEKIQDAAIEVLLGKKLERIEATGAIVADEKKRETRINVDVVVLALGARPAQDLAKELAGEVETFVVGDGDRPRRIIDAVYEGFRTALKL